jgi:transposase InsO family protein
MKSNGIKAKTKRRFKATTKSKHDFLVADNLLNQRFSADEANKVWVSDISVPQQAA